MILVSTSYGNCTQAPCAMHSVQYVYVWVTNLSESSFQAIESGLIDVWKQWTYTAMKEEYLQAIFYLTFAILLLLFWNFVAVSLVTHNLKV